MGAARAAETRLLLYGEFLFFGTCFGDVKPEHSGYTLIMVNQAARIEFAELLRHFIAGRVLNADYDKQARELCETGDDDDVVICCIYLEVWLLYDDFGDHYMTGAYKIDKQGRHEIARWILFLQSNLEYQWRFSSPDQARRHLISVLTFNLFPAFREPSYKKFGNEDVWPFYKTEDFLKAVGNPKLLSGT